MICIIDYGVGNLFSLKSSLAHLGLEAKISADAADIRAADRLILPGVGAFGDAMAKLEATGLVPVIREEAAQKLLLGICLGMQMMNTYFLVAEEAQRRAELCMEIQAEIMDGFAETFIGRELDVLVMGREPDGTPWGRSEYDSPDIDSRVIFSGDAKPGDMVRVRIDSVDDGELIGEQI